MTESKNTQNQPAPDAVEAALDRIEEAARILSGFAAMDKVQAALMVEAQCCHLGNNAGLIRSHVSDLRAELAALLARAEAQRVALEAADRLTERRLTERLAQFTAQRSGARQSMSALMHDSAQTIGEVVAAYRAARTKAGA
jgi:hypothetical protein